MGIASIRQYDSIAAEAAAFAVRAHEGQVRKGTKFPYVVHPIGVAHILRAQYPDDENLEAAGYLHDVLEDTDTTLADFDARFGPDIAHLVLGVTDRPGVYRYWSLSHYIDEPRVLRLKAADMVDNITETIRGLEKGHDVWSRFSSGQRKADRWIGHAHLIDEVLGDGLSTRLVGLAEKAGAMR